MRFTYRVLFLLVILPSLVFMLFAAIGEGLAWKLDETLKAIANKGWPE